MHALAEQMTELMKLKDEIKQKIDQFVSHGQASPDKVRYQQDEKQRLEEKIDQLALENKRL